MSGTRGKGLSIKYKVAVDAVLSIIVLTVVLVAFGYRLFESNVMDSYGKYATTVLEYAYRVTEDYKFGDMIKNREMSEGYEDMRRMFEECPKFGNDDAEADEMARRVLDKLWSEVGLYDTFRGPDPFLGACSLLGGGIAYGRVTWALPDGRFKGEPLGNTIGPAPGRDVDGLTAMLNSVAKLNLRRGLGGTSARATSSLRAGGGGTTPFSASGSSATSGASLCNSYCSMSRMSFCG